MQVATLQKKESAKSPELESSSHKDPRVDAQQEQTTEAGVPLFLQRFAVSSLSTPPPIQRQSEEKEEELIQTKPITPFVQREVLEEDEIEKNPVFPKLTVGAPNDKYEQEADRVASNVVSKPKHIVKVAGDQEAEGGDTQVSDTQSPVSPVQAKNNKLRTPKATSQVAKIVRFPSGGSSLPEHVRNSVEPHVGADLGHVKVYNDSPANRAAKSINAKSFTHQNNIFLGRGQSPNDLFLMAHEATHVVQQGATSNASPATAQGSKANLVQRYSLGELGELWDNTGGAAVSKVKSGASTVYS